METMDMVDWLGSNRISNVEILAQISRLGNLKREIDSYPLSLTK